MQPASTDAPARPTIGEQANIMGGYDVTIRAADRAQAERERDRYLASYHPCGYDTRFSEPSTDETGACIIRGTRRVSC